MRTLLRWIIKYAICFALSLILCFIFFKSEGTGTIFRFVGLVTLIDILGDIGAAIAKRAQRRYYEE